MADPLKVVKSTPLTQPLSVVKPAQAAPVSSPSSWYSPIVDFASQLQSLNPVSVLGGVKEAVTNPIGVVKGLGAENARLFGDAEAAFKSGDYATGLRKVLSYLSNAVPGMGSRLDQAADYLQQGEEAKALGATVDAAIPLAGPAMLKRAGNVNVRGAMSPNPNLAERAAADFGIREGIPVDAATATGNKSIRLLQSIPERTTIAGSVVERNTRHAQAQGLSRVGHELAERAHPKTGYTPETAGDSVRIALKDRIDKLHSEANAAYDALRKVEADPANKRTVILQQVDAEGDLVDVPTEMQLPVDLRSVKRDLLPVYEDLSRQWPLTRRQASPNYQALENVVKGDDFSPLSRADRDLGMLKELARKEGGLAKMAVAKMDEAVQDAVRGAGPVAAKALRDGRAATKAKYTVIDTLESLSEEPVKAFRNMTLANDAGIDRLRAVAQAAPGEMGKVGRAYLEDLMTKATAEGGFNRADALFKDWQNLGPSTKRLLFKDPAYIKDLDSFFLLAKRMATNPNPSGTAYAGGLIVHATNGWFMRNLPGAMYVEMSGYTLSKLLKTRRGVQLLTRGFTLPAQSAAAPTLAAEIMSLAERADDSER